MAEAATAEPDPARAPQRRPATAASIRLAARSGDDASHGFRDRLRDTGDDLAGRIAAVPAPLLGLAITLVALFAHALLWGARAPWGHAPAAGAVAAAAGLAWAGWAARLLRRAATVPGLAAGRRVFVDHGPYGWGRHPMYLGLAVAMLGAGLASGVPLVGAAATVFVVAVDRLHVPREEAALRRAHGAWYSDYAGDVPRWF